MRNEKAKTNTFQHLNKSSQLHRLSAVNAQQHKTASNPFLTNRNRRLWQLSRPKASELSDCLNNLTLHTLQLLNFQTTEQSDPSHSTARELSDDCLNNLALHTLQLVSFQMTVEQSGSSHSTARELSDDCLNNLALHISYSTAIELSDDSLNNLTLHTISSTAIELSDDSLKNLTLHTLQLLCFQTTVWTIRPIALCS